MTSLDQIFVIIGFLYLVIILVILTGFAYMSIMSLFYTIPYHAKKTNKCECECAFDYDKLM